MLMSEKDSIDSIEESDFDCMEYCPVELCGFGFLDLDLNPSKNMNPNPSPNP